MLAMHQRSMGIEDIHNPKGDMKAKLKLISTLRRFCYNIVKYKARSYDKSTKKVLPLPCLQVSMRPSDRTRVCDCDGTQPHFSANVLRLHQPKYQPLSSKHFISNC